MPEAEELESKVKPGGLPEWERRESESARAYRAFMLYVSMDADRSLSKVAQKLCVSKTIIARWSAQFNWIERARQHDQHASKERLARLSAARENLVDAQVRAAQKMLALIETSLPRLTRRKLNAQNVSRMFTAVARTLQSVFGDEPLSARKPGDVCIRVELDKPRFPQYDYSRLPEELKPKSMKKPQ
jgi:hypothetical protein